MFFLTVTDANEYIVVSRLIVHVLQIDSHLQCIFLISQIVVILSYSYKSFYIMNRSSTVDL